MTQEAIKTRKQAKQNCDDSLASLSEIWTKLKTQIKNRNKNMQNDETTPKYVGYDENKLQEMKTTKRIWILKVDAKQTRLRRVKLEYGT